MGDRIIEAKDLKKYFPLQADGFFAKSRHMIKAVDGLSFHIDHGETLGLVGESGCGKSTAGRVLLRLIEATAGEVIFEGRDILKLGKGEMRSMRREMQIVFQDPYASLDPRKTVFDIISEPYRIHGIGHKSDRELRVRELLETVGLRPEHIRRYPHEFSGGQRQRIGLARALALRPKFVMCDEPVSALDVSIQAQVVNLMKDLQQKFQLTYLFISHDLRVVKHISDRVGVMYLGALVELADKKELYRRPLHPYTAALLSAVPLPTPEKKAVRILLEGDVPSPVDPPGGCRFHTRCAEAKEICREQCPAFKDVGAGHFCACHFR
jgi:oligopeptide transport system ATP-binding protein